MWLPVVVSRVTHNYIGAGGRLLSIFSNRTQSRGGGWVLLTREVYTCEIREGTRGYHTQSIGEAGGG